MQIPSEMVEIINSIENEDMRKHIKKYNFSEYEIEKIKNALKIYSFYIPQIDYIDHSGEIYNRLKILYKTYDYNCNSYVCLCDCGNFIKARYSAVHNGKTKSCGCYHNEANCKKRKDNKYDLNGEFGRGWTYNTHKEFWFDKEDYNLIKDYAWKEDSNGYISTTRNNKTMLLHRIILNISDKKIFVDHIKHNKWDNRKEKIRLISPQNNTFNKSLAKNNKSGITGVTLERNKWRAYIWHNGKTIHLGSYNNINDAIKARRKAENLYFGKYSFFNSMKEVQNEN